MTRSSCFLLCLLCLAVPSTGFSWEAYTLEPPPDSLITLEDLGSTVHLYGPPNAGEFDITASYPWFANVFNLYVSDLIPQLWDSTDIAGLITSIMDGDSTSSEDVFSRTWDYFCFGDQDPRYDHVSFTVGSVNYSKIDIVLYHQDDLCITGKEYACKNYGWYSGGNQLFMSGTDKSLWALYAHSTFPHELEHLCYTVNGLWSLYSSIRESMARCAEHRVRGYQFYGSAYHPLSPIARGFEVSYDANIYRGEKCELPEKYLVEEMWMGYLYDVFHGNPNDISDDLVYRWLREAVESSHEISMQSLAEVLTSSDYSWLEGVTGSQRLQNLFQFYAIAKFCNAPEFGEYGQFGYDPSFNPVKDLNMFLDVWPPDSAAQPQLPVDCPRSACGHPYPCGGSWNVRIIPPSYCLGVENENTLTEVAGIYRDGDATPADTTDGDKSRDYIDFATYGTDYLVFKTQSYFQDGRYHELHFTLEGENSAPPPNSEVKMWIVGYSTADDTLQLHPEDIVFMEPVPIAPGTTNGDFVVTDFGRSVKSVVVILTMVETTATEETVFNYLTYKYRYGVYSSESPTTSWKGDVFARGDIEIGENGATTINPGTQIHIAPQDWSSSGADTNLVELNVWGTLDVQGTPDDPVTFVPWGGDPQPGYWNGIRLFGTNSSATLSHCSIQYAKYGVMSPTTVEMDHCEVSDCVDANVYVYEEGGSSNSSVFSNCTFSNADDSGVEGTGIRIWNIADTVLVDSCTFDNNYHGIWVANAAAAIANSTFDENERDGIFYASSVLGGSVANCTIQHSDHGIRCGSTIEMTDCEIKYCSESGAWMYEEDGLSNASSIVDCDISENCYGYQGAGLRIWDSSHTVLVDSCTISNNIYGVWVSNSSPLIRHSQLVTNEADGVYVTSYQSQIPTNPRIEWCDIQGSTENGVYFYYEPGEISNTKIWDSGTYGILCQGMGASPEIDHTKIIDNLVAGVRANSYGAPILGIVSLGKGQNNSLYGQNKNVYNATSAVTISAENCWWGASPPDPAKFYGNVTYRPYLTSDPVGYLVSLMPDPKEVVKLALDQNYPNPFWDGGLTTISYSLPNAQGRVTLTVYDVSGRRVKTLVDIGQERGAHYVLWDGRNEQGAAVAPGMYFYRLSIGNRSISKKLMFVR